MEIDQDGFTRKCNLVVLPFTGYPEVQEPLYVVLFEEAVPVDAKAVRSRQPQRPDRQAAPP